MGRYEVWDHGRLVCSCDDRDDAYHAYNVAVNRAEKNKSRGTIELLDNDSIDFVKASYYVI